MTVGETRLRNVLFRRKKIFGLIIFAILLVGGIEVKNQFFKKSGESLGASTAFLTHPLLYFDEKTFYEGINRAKEDKIGFPYEVAGGITPHHTFPSYMIAGFFKRLAHQGPETIILVGPNHQDIGSFKALTSTYGWETPFGILEANAEIINNLAKQELVRIDEVSLSGEQSISALVPYIKYYLPDTKVVPIILKSSFSQPNAYVLGKKLAKLVDKKTVLVAPVDFSHYLTSQIAKEKDEITIEIIKNYDLPNLFTLSSDYLDSPPAIAVLLIAMKEKSKNTIEVVYHTNSGELQNDDYIPTTSYFVLIFH